MTVYLSAAIAEHAQRIQRDHAPVEGTWWCAFCHRHGFGKVAAGKCSPFLRAEAFIQHYRRQQGPRPARPPTRPTT